MNGLQRQIRKHVFMRLGAIQMQTNGQAITIHDQHHFAALADFGIAYSRASFLREQSSRLERLLPIQAFLGRLN